MALPTLTKTWQGIYGLAIAESSALLAQRSMFFALKNALLSMPLAPWVMRYSCNSATAGTAGDGVDRLTSSTNFIWAAPGAAHSWFVVRQTGISATFELCFSFESASTTGANMLLHMSSTGFTGGTTLLRPTAADEVQVHSGTWNLGITNYSTRLTVMQSTDGQCTRIITAANNAAQAYILIERPYLPTPGWANPVVACANNGSAGFNVTVLASTTTAPLRMRIGGITTGGAMTCEGTATAALSTDSNVGLLANEVSGEWGLYPLGFVATTAGVRGRHGQLQDLWFGSGGANSGDTYPNDASNRFAQFGHLVIPWNGSGVPLT